MLLRAYIVANTLAYKLIKLFYKIFKKVVAIDFDCVIICSSKANKLNKKIASHFQAVFRYEIFTAL